MKNKQAELKYTEYKCGNCDRTHYALPMQLVVYLLSVEHNYLFLDDILFKNDIVDVVIKQNTAEEHIVISWVIMKNLEIIDTQMSLIGFEEAAELVADYQKQEAKNDKS